LIGMFTCPVCGYPELEEDPVDERGPHYEICRSCGFEPGYTDLSEYYSIGSWREKWIAEGMKFRDPPAPPGWDPLLQPQNLDR